MKTVTKGFLSLLCPLLIIFCLGSCKKPDPLSVTGAQTFGQAAQAGHATFQNGYLVFTAPGERDYLAMSTNPTKNDDLLLGLDLSDFMQAGFDPSRIAESDFTPGYPVYDLPTSTLIVSWDMGNTAFSWASYVNADGKPLSEPTPETVYSELLRVYPTRIHYALSQNRWAITFGSGVSMQWNQSEDGKKVSMDFVIDPAPYVKTGLSLEKLKKWKVVTIPATPPETVASVRLVLSLALN